VTWLRLTSGISFPPTWKMCSRFCPVLISICKMRCKWLFIRPLRASGLEKDGAGNAWLRHLGIIGKCTVLAWWTGVMAGRVAELLRDAPLMFFASKCGALWLVPAQRGRVAIVEASNLKTHTSAGSLLVRSMLTELKEHLYLVYTPAYDPDANRIEWHGPRLAAGRDA
jgi:hypothetical protein